MLPKRTTPKPKITTNRPSKKQLLSTVINTLLLLRCFFELALIAQQELNNSKAYSYLAKVQDAFILSTKDRQNFLSDKKTYPKILDALAHLYHSEQRLNQAFGITQKAVKIVEKLRLEYKEEGSKLFLLQQMIPTFELSIQLDRESYLKTKDRKYLEHAFDLVEKNKAMLLLDAIKSEKARNTGNISQKLLAEEQRIKRAIKKYEKRLFEAQSNEDYPEIERCQKEILKLKIATDALEKQLKKDYPKYYELKYNNQTASLTEIQQSIDK